MMYTFCRTLRVFSYLFFELHSGLSWSDLSNIAFDPNYALFKNTEGNLMYPNPSSKFVHGSEHILLFEFLGRILGKALYEGSESLSQITFTFALFQLTHTSSILIVTSTCSHNSASVRTSLPVVSQRRSHIPAFTY